SRGRALVSSAVAPRMEPKHAATVAAPAVNALVQAMKDAKDPGALRALTEALSAVAARLEPKDAVTSLVEATRNPKTTFALEALGQSLSAEAARRDGQEPPPARTTL